MNEGKATILNGKVYFGGGAGDKSGDYYNVYCYDLSHDTWTTLPPLPIHYYALGQVNGKLAAIGGVKDRMGRRSNEVYTYNEVSHHWKRTTPHDCKPMARDCMGILNTQSALIVAGGEYRLRFATNVVEIVHHDTLQWCRTDPLPTECCSLSMVAIGNECYALGGYQFPSHLNQVFSASFEYLLRNAVPASKTTHSGSSANTQSVWETLPNTPYYGSAAAVLAGNLLAIGGWETSREKDFTERKEVYMYSPSTKSWIYVSDLPEPRANTAIAILSSTEILVIGGSRGDYRTKSVLKGTLR